MPRFGGTLVVADAPTGGGSRFGGTPVSAGPPKPGSREYADWAAKQARAGKTLPQISEAPEWQPPADVLPAPVRAFTTNMIESVPVIGAMAANARDPMMRAIDERAAKEAPWAATAGSVTGTVAPFVAGAGIPGIATILGLDVAAPMAANIVLGGLSNAGLTAADSMIRGDSPAEIGTETAISGIGGALGAPVAKLAGMGIDAVSKPIGRVISGLRNPEKAGQDVIGRAIAADASSALSPADEAAAALNGQPLVNADRFGSNVRTLARTSANMDPTAKQALSDVVQDRFLTQNQRAADWIVRNTGAPTNVHALRNTLRDSARTANSVAYKAAYKAPEAAAIFTPEIGNMMQLKEFQTAIREATNRGKTDAVLHGYAPIKNPFRFKSDGSYALVDGVTPNLQFWDIVQRNLRDSAEAAARRGKNFEASQVGDVRKMLLEQLDSAVPAFQTARTGAAAAFGAEDALEAGQNFIGTSMSDLPGLQAAHAKFSPAEKKLFASGYSASLIDKVGKTGDTTNVINQVFASPAARAQVELALGKRAATELEPFLRVENIMHMTKNAVQAGSNTAAQLAAMGALGAVSGGAMSGWNPTHMATGAGLFMAGKTGMKALGQMVDARVMQSIANALASKDTKAISHAVRNATRSPQSAGAIKAIETGLQMAIQRGSMAAAPALVGAEAAQ